MKDTIFMLIGMILLSIIMGVVLSALVIPCGNMMNILTK